MKREKTEPGKKGNADIWQSQSDLGVGSERLLRVAQSHFRQRFPSGKPVFSQTGLGVLFSVCIQNSVRKCSK